MSNVKGQMSKVTNGSGVVVCPAALTQELRMPDELNQLTLLLNQLDGSSGAEERAFQLVYGELRRIAHRVMSREPAANSYQPTELLHEAYVKKLRGLRVPIRNRQHFYSLATRAMRQVLIENARRRQAEKRQAPAPATAAWTLSAGAGLRDPVQALQVAELLEKLQEIDPRAATVVDLRFFLGCSLEETAEDLGVSLRSVRDDWDFARIWLRKRLDGGGG
jgi:RNA polymerase sigma factor (TIGR02999 family)